MATNQMKRAPKAQIAVQSILRNSTAVPMTLQRQINWSGRPEQGFPSEIPAGGRANFVHRSGPDDSGSKAAIVYTGRNAANEACSWVLAWDAPPEHNTVTPNKVYALCGTTSIIDTIDFNQILGKLDAEGAGGSHASDAASKTLASGIINSLEPHTAFVGGDFSLIP